MDEVESLRRRVEELEKQLRERRDKDATARERIEHMSAEVVDSNPYR